MRFHKKYQIRTLAGGILFLSAMQSFAAQIHVPGDQPAIQSGIDAAVDGDTVIVDPGEYFENINLHGKNILLTSHFYETMDYTQIENTIINGSTPADPDSASVILIISGEGPGCIIQGFTIAGGAGTKWLDEHGAGMYREGGGILMQYSSPTIRYNYIMNNIVTNYDGVLSTGGGAMRCGDSNPLIQNNVIINNEAAGYGGGLVFNYCDHAVVKNNIIAFNSGGNDYGGGGVWATGENASQSVDLINNTLVRNTATGGGGYGGKGGGVFIFTVTANITNSIVWANVQTTMGPLYTIGGVISTNYSDIEGGYAGDGNINADPLFADTIMCYLLDTLSPCIDAGNPDNAFADIASDLIPETAAYPSRGNLTNDMGVNGGPDVLLIGECVTAEPTGIPASYLNNFHLYPNPANDFLISDMNGNYLFELISVAGNKMLSLVADGKEIIDISRFDSGMYFYKITSQDQEIRSGKLLIK